VCVWKTLWIRWSCYQCSRRHSALVLGRGDEPGSGPTDRGPKGEKRECTIEWDGRECRLIMGGAMRPMADGTWGPLTDGTKAKIVQLARQGKNKRKIAWMLGVSLGTVRNYARKVPPPEGPKAAPNPPAAVPLSPDCPQLRGSLLSRIIVS
jgi:hypothetical protein